LNPQICSLIVNNARKNLLYYIIYWGRVN